MIIDNIKITNFGLYKGENLVQLQPDPLLGRNITVVSGQNGVGKSTLQEAIHLCLLGSLSIDNRVTEANYEKYLLKRAHRENLAVATTARTSLEIVIRFLKSGSFVNYRITRTWTNDPKNIDEDIFIEEDGQVLSDLNKKEKNMFLRELIQPGVAKIMFFDGEKLLSLYDQKNLTEFIGEGCKYLFGLNFIDLLNTDLGYYINKLYTQQDKSQSLNEIIRLKESMAQTNADIIALQDRKNSLTGEQRNLRAKAAAAEKAISDQGRWIVDKLDDFKSEKQKLETNIATARRELIELYSALGPFVFCKNLVAGLKDRLLAERDLEKWQHARELLQNKISELEDRFRNTSLLEELSLDRRNGEKLLDVVRDALLDGPAGNPEQERIHHGMADNVRTQVLGWIEEILGNVSAQLLGRSEKIASYDEQLKKLTREQASFSKEDAIASLLKETAELNKAIGASEQQISSLIRNIEEANRRKEQDLNRLEGLESKLQDDQGVDEKLKLSTRTKNVLETYAKQLLERKLLLLAEKVLEKFNLLCRKDSYLDRLHISKEDFEIILYRQGNVVEHSHLSAGEKQLLIISFLWGLRELTNIALPLIIDTPLARLDLEHRRAFIEDFLPEIQPQVILIGTDMELTGEVTRSMDSHIARQYVLSYDAQEHATKLTEVERIYKENV